jgi:hypothetical protein
MIVSSIVINAALLLLPYKDPANIGIITQLSELMRLLAPLASGRQADFWR